MLGSMAKPGWISELQVPIRQAICSHRHRMWQVWRFLVNMEQWPFLHILSDHFSEASMLLDVEQYCPSSRQNQPYLLGLTHRLVCILNTQRYDDGWIAFG